MVLHLQSSKRNLLLSFLLTALILTSIGFTMMFNPMDLSYAFHYVLFGCLLLVVLIDYQYVLKGVDAPRLFKRKEPAAITIKEPEPAVRRSLSLFSKKAIPAQQLPRPLVPKSVADFKRTSDTMVQKIQNVGEDLQRKPARIEKFEKKIRQQQNASFLVEKNLSAPDFASLDLKDNVPVKHKNLIQNIPSEEQIILKERIENHLIISEMDHIVAVIQRGIFRDISNSFADFLGYERTELLQKNFFVFIAPRGFDDARKYYLNRLKGSSTNSFRTVLLTKTQTELPVEITIAPTVYKGDSAEFLTIKEIKD